MAAGSSAAGSVASESDGHATRSAASGSTSRR
jgi:hypothetical protein